MEDTQTSVVNVEPLPSDQQDFALQSASEQQLGQQGIMQQRDGHVTPAEKNLDDSGELEDDDEDDDYDDDDDDEEKENSQKLVIDIDDDEEEEEEEEDDAKEIVEQHEVVIVEPTHNMAQQSLGKDIPRESAIVKPSSPLRSDEPEAIITLSDAEEEVSTVDVNAKPGKIQKRKSVGAPLRPNEEERFRLKRRKINVEGAPKMPLTGKKNTVHYGIIK